MELSVDQILTLAAGGVIGITALYLYHHASRRKETIIYRAKLVVTSVVLYVGGLFILAKMGYPASTVLVGGILLGLSAKMIVKRPRDTRYIPKGVKRAVIARDLEDGEEYDPNDTTLTIQFHIQKAAIHRFGTCGSCRKRRIFGSGGAKRPRLRDFL